jgi:hypothetical protein
VALAIASPASKIVMWRAKCMQSPGVRWAHSMRAESGAKHFSG